MSYQILWIAARSRCSAGLARVALPELSENSLQNTQALHLWDESACRDRPSRRRPCGTMISWLSLRGAAMSAEAGELATRSGGNGRTLPRKAGGHCESQEQKRVTAAPPRAHRERTVQEFMPISLAGCLGFVRVMPFTRPTERNVPLVRNRRSAWGLVLLAVTADGPIHFGDLLTIRRHNYFQGVCDVGSGLAVVAQTASAFPK